MEKKHYLPLSESVLSQTFTDFELLVIDDCSSDQTEEVANNYAKKDNRIKVLGFKENKGRCAARNLGIENASGVWNCFLDSDDIYFDNHLDVLAQLIEENTSYFAFVTNQIVKEKPKTYEQKNYYNKNLL
ncbi:MAG: glycosyltransferase family A protein [Chitinophagales bacterium]